MNNFRLSSNPKFKDPINSLDLESKLSNLLSLPSPYRIKGEIRYVSKGNNLISNKRNIIAIYSDNKKQYFSSITECSKILGFGRRTIKNCLLSGKTHKGFKFIYNI